MNYLTLSLIFILLGYVSADTPANCTYDDVAGIWSFHEGPRGNTNQLDCTTADAEAMTHMTIVQLLYPNKAVDQNGNEGSWTMVYNQGFEVIINSRKYFAFSLYESNSNGTVTNFCHKTFNGWSHDIFSRDWACYYGEKMSVAGVPHSPKLSTDFIGAYKSNDIRGNFLLETYKTNTAFVEKINEVQKEWTAKVYEEYDGVVLQAIVGKLGGIKSRVHSKPQKLNVELPQETLQEVARLPESFDWRNVGGKNYVTPVRNQGHCGSCYAFGSTAMLEARTLVVTNLAEMKVFSPQDIVACTDYAQGCLGGFPYLIAGKYGEDFGVVEESCNPYVNPEPTDPVCGTTPQCRRYYSTKYYYVGGFYGGCTEELMRLELVQNGPIAVSFEVYDDFMHYSGGVYHYTGLKDDENKINKFDPFHITNHVVLIVGYGVDTSTKQPYWLVKNSWGSNWGEDGYFRIRRGNDEVSIESIAVAVTPIPTY